MMLNTAVLNGGLLGGATLTRHELSCMAYASGTVVYADDAPFIISLIKAESVGVGSSEASGITKVTLLAQGKSSSSVTAKLRLQNGLFAKAVGALHPYAALSAYQRIQKVEAYLETFYEENLATHHNASAEAKATGIAQAYFSNTTYIYADAYLSTTGYVIIRGHLVQAQAEVSTSVDVNLVRIQLLESNYKAYPSKGIAIADMYIIRTLPVSGKGKSTGFADVSVRQAGNSYFTHEIKANAIGSVALDAKPNVIGFMYSEGELHSHASAYGVLHHTYTVHAKATGTAEIRDGHVTLYIEAISSARALGSAALSTAVSMKVIGRATWSSQIRRLRHRHAIKSIARAQGYAVTNEHVHHGAFVNAVVKGIATNPLDLLDIIGLSATAKATSSVAVSLGTGYTIRTKGIATGTVNTNLSALQYMYVESLGEGKNLRSTISLTLYVKGNSRSAGKAVANLSNILPVQASGNGKLKASAKMTNAISMTVKAKGSSTASAETSITYALSALASAVLTGDAEAMMNIHTSDPDSRRMFRPYNNRNMHRAYTNRVMTRKVTPTHLYRN